MFFLVAARRASRLGGSAHAAAKRECRHPGCCRSKTESANACQISSGFADRMRHRIQLTLAVRGGTWRLAGEKVRHSMPSQHDVARGQRENAHPYCREKMAEPPLADSVWGSAGIRPRLPGDRGITFQRALAIRCRASYRLPSFGAISLLDRIGSGRSGAARLSQPRVRGWLWIDMGSACISTATHY